MVGEKVVQRKEGPELGHNQQDLEKARQQSDKAKKAVKEHALTEKMEVDLILENVSQEFEETKRSHKRSEARVLRLSLANSNLQSRYSNLEDAFTPPAKDFAEVKRI